MMDLQAGEILTRYAAEIAKRCYPFTAGTQEPTPAQERARNAAWRLMSHLQPVVEHIKESDMFFKLLDKANEDGNEKEAQRCYAITRQEDRGFARTFGELERLLKDVEADEKKDPDAKKYAAQVSKAAKARADNREQERLERNSKARERNAAKKAAAPPAKSAWAAAAPKATAKELARMKAVMEAVDAKPPKKVAAKKAAAPAKKVAAKKVTKAK